MKPALLALALVSSVCAQRTWIVDQWGRQSDFLDLPPALVAASDGDVIILRSTAGHPYYPLPGYTTATTSKGVTILGEPGAAFASSNFAPLTVAALPPQRIFVLAGIHFPNGSQGILLTGCAGSIHIDRITANTSGGFLRFTNCRQVTVCNSAITCSSGIVELDGAAPMDVAFIDCAFRSASSIGIQVGGRIPLTAARLLISGGILAAPTPIYYSTGGTPGSPALTIAGGSATTIVSLDISPGTAIIWNSSTPLVIDPLARIVGSITSSGTPIMRSSPGLSAMGAPPGQSVRASIRSGAGETSVLLVSVPMQRTPTPPFGDLWIDPSLIFFAVGGIQGSSGQLDFSIPTPTSAPRGLVLGLQALSGPGIDLRLSNPSVVAIN